VEVALDVRAQGLGQVDLGGQSEREVGRTVADVFWAMPSRCDMAWTVEASADVSSIK